MLQKKSKKIIIYFFLLFIFGSINNISLSKVELYSVKNINLSGLSELESKSLLYEINRLNLANIFNLNEKKINNLIQSNPRIEKYNIFKKYPSTIDIEIKKTTYLARLNYKGELMLIGSNGKLSKYDNKINMLPIIFGNPDIEEFLKFKEAIDRSKFSYKNIQNLYFYPSKRWDIKFKDDTLIKLSKNYTTERLNDVHQFLKSLNKNKFIIIDARIKNQIILND